MYKRHHADTPPQTRASEAVRKRHRHQQRPLPFDLQVLPPIRKRTPKHPECTTRHHVMGIYLQLVHMRDPQFLAGELLSRDPARFAVHVDGKLVGYHDDGQFALAYAYAAAEGDLTATVLDTNT